MIKYYYMYPCSLESEGGTCWNIKFSTFSLSAIAFIFCIFLVSNPLLSRIWYHNLSLMCRLLQTSGCANSILKIQITCTLYFIHLSLRFLHKIWNYWGMEHSIKFCNLIWWSVENIGILKFIFIFKRNLDIHKLYNIF